jgi:SAM-dependent methyltransferase
MLENDSKADIIVHCHDLYYLDNKEKVLLDCIDRLNPGGFMLVILEDDDGIARIRQKFCPTKYYFSSNLMSSLVECNPQIKQYLVDVVNIDGQIDIKEPSSNLLNFFVLGRSELIEQLKQYLCDSYPDNVMSQKSKMYIFARSS